MQDGCSQGFGTCLLGNGKRRATVTQKALDLGPFIVDRHERKSVGDSTQVKNALVGLLLRALG